MHEDAGYIYRKQLEESDLILITKTDTLTPEALDALKAETRAAFPASRVMAVSALKDQGIDAWLADLAEHTEAGTRLLKIDYDRYAHGEAAPIPHTVLIRWSTSSGRSGKGGATARG